jgi:hypothetical protein
MPQAPCRARSLRPLSTGERTQIGLASAQIDPNPREIDGVEAV